MKEKWPKLVLPRVMVVIWRSSAMVLAAGVDGGDGENGCERKGVEMGNRREMERQREEG